MDLLLDFLTVVVSIFMLWFGANWLVEAATRIARRIGVSDLIIGLTVVAIGTSAPEFAVTVSSAIRGQAEISAGNVVGSNIFNLGFILGGLALFRAIPTTRKIVLRDGVVLVSVTALIVFFMANDLFAGASFPQLQRWEGAIMLVLLISYMTYLIFQREETDEDIPQGDFQWMDIVRFLGGVALIVAGGQFLVGASVDIARYFGISEWVISVTIVAFGTSAPEVVTSFVALVKGYSDISIGNLIGSNLFNLLGVLGLASVLQPLTISDPGAWGSVILMLVMVSVVVWMMRTGWRLTRLEGGLLVVISVFYIVGTVIAGSV